MIIVNLHSQIPIYEQIKEQIISLIQKGAYGPHDQLPSIRSLAQQLGLNVNTIKRAFNELEADGIVYSLPGRGNFVCEGAVENRKVKDDSLRELEAQIVSSKLRGVEKREIISLVEKIYEKGEH